MKRLIIICVLLLSLTACTGSIQNATKNYSESSVAIKEFARISAQDWLLGSGIIQEALKGRPETEWIIEDLKIIDAWFFDADGNEITDPKLNSLQIGKIVGAKLRLAGPVTIAAIEQFAPGILAYAEVGAVLAFIGL